MSNDTPILIDTSSGAWGNLDDTQVIDGASTALRRWLNERTYSEVIDFGQMHGEPINLLAMRLAFALLGNTCPRTVGTYKGKRAVYMEFDLHCAELAVICSEDDSKEIFLFKVCEEGQGYKWLQSLADWSVR